MRHRRALGHQPGLGRRHRLRRGWAALGAPEGSGEPEVAATIAAPNVESPTKRLPFREPYVVDGTDGLCSIREAVTAANDDVSSGAAVGECPAGSGADTILIAQLHSIITLSGRLTISSDLTGLVTTV